MNQVIIKQILYKILLDITYMLHQDILI